VDDRLKELMQELGNAINESLSDSERIASAIGEIKRAGYDVFLVLEATIGFNKRGAEVRSRGQDQVDVAGSQVPPRPEDLAGRGLARGGVGTGSSAPVVGSVQE
jgi:hypothetical protein